MSDIDDPPWADPGVKEAYAQALGRMLVAFNAVENEVSGLIMRLIPQPELAPVRDRLRAEPFGRRLDTLLSLRNTHPAPLATCGLDTLKALAARRNHFAHGFMDQNPFDGSFAIVSGKQTTQGFQSHLHSAPHDGLAELDQLTQDCDTAFDRLRSVSLWFDFDDLDGEA
ncbi:hypothetical protein [Aestuariivita sp.]|uniref:hypothetical protein n=1 Tax=Aestuariivita sp. TaxID=1872407 RepID=UPI00216F3B3C|nr:hypothetical protein [Aestuariivita sp.]MCE8007194.1 hypothetical protein [Aestuariivita sp.]